MYWLRQKPSTKPTFWGQLAMYHLTIWFKKKQNGGDMFDCEIFLVRWPPDFVDCDFKFGGVGSADMSSVQNPFSEPFSDH